MYACTHVCAGEKVSFRIPRNPLCLGQASLTLIHVFGSLALSRLYDLFHFSLRSRLSSSSLCPMQMEEPGGAIEAPDISSCNKKLHCSTHLYSLTCKVLPQSRRDISPSSL